MRKKISIAILAVLALSGCTTISIKSADGTCTASYSGLTIIGAEEMTGGTLNGVTSCGASGQNIQQIAQLVTSSMIANGMMVAIPAPSAAQPAAK